MRNHITTYFIAARAGNTSDSGSFDVKIGQSVMQSARHTGSDAIAADCGGSLTCATCHVYIDPAWADQLSDDAAPSLT